MTASGRGHVRRPGRARRRTGGRRGGHAGDGRMRMPKADAERQDVRDGQGRRHGQERKADHSANGDDEEDAAGRQRRSAGGGAAIGPTSTAPRCRSGWRKMTATMTKMNQDAEKIEKAGREPRSPRSSPRPIGSTSTRCSAAESTSPSFAQSAGPRLRSRRPRRRARGGPGRRRPGGAASAMRHRRRRRLAAEQRPRRSCGLRRVIPATDRDRTVGQMRTGLTTGVRRSGTASPARPSVLAARPAIDPTARIRIRPSLLSRPGV